MAAGFSSFWLLPLLTATGVSFAALGDDLPPGVPNPIGPDGKYTPGLMFTTKAYHAEAFRLVVQEANRVATELRLPEKLPITEADLVERFINAFGYAHVRKAIGNVKTSNYTYYVSQGNKFSYLEGTHQAEDCRRYQQSYTWPLSRMDTNEAYQLASQWLAALSMDVESLNRHCQVHVQPCIADNDGQSGHFIPLYWVYWTKRPAEGGSVASVQLFAPTKTLLQLRVEDPVYILRDPLRVPALSWTTNGVVDNNDAEEP